MDLGDVITVVVCLVGAAGCIYHTPNLWRTGKRFGGVVFLFVALANLAVAVDTIQAAMRYS